MDEEMQEKYRNRIKELMKLIPTLEPGSKEYDASVSERESLEKALAEYDKLTQAAYDNEENRKVEIEKSNTQAKSEKHRSVLGFLGAVLGFLGTIVGVGGLLKNNKMTQDFTVKSNEGAYSIDKTMQQNASSRFNVKY